MSIIGILLDTLNNVSNAIVQVNYNPDESFFTNNVNFISVENPELENLLNYSYTNLVFTFEQDLADYYIGQSESNEVYISKINEQFGAVSTGIATLDEQTNFSNAITSMGGTYPPWSGGSGVETGTETVNLSKGSNTTVSNIIDANYCIIKFTGTFVGYGIATNISNGETLRHYWGVGNSAVYTINFSTGYVELSNNSDTSSSVVMNSIMWFKV